MENVIKSICDLVFDQDTNDTLKISLRNGIEIPLCRQFYLHFKDKYVLKYDNLDQILAKAAEIYDYTKQDIIKYKHAKRELDRLNSAQAFFRTATEKSNNSGTSGTIDNRKHETKNKSQGLSLSRADATAAATQQSLARSGASEINEDYRNIEDKWRSQDEKYGLLDKGANKKIFDIQIPDNLEDVDLKTQILSSAVSPSASSGPQEEPEAPVVSYTGISLNKGWGFSEASNSQSSKGLASSASSQSGTTQGLSTTISNNDGQSLHLKFTYGDAVLTSLGRFVANFREEFFSSFTPLFIEVWSGY